MIFSWLAAMLGMGGLSSLLLVPPKAFGRRFHGLMGFMASLLLAAALAGSALHGPMGRTLVAAAGIWVLFTQWGPIPWIRPLLGFLAAFGWGVTLGGAAFDPRLPLLMAARWAAPMNALSAGLLLGSVSMGMLVGHWYLNVPGLDIKHLRRMTWFLAACLVLRIFLGLASLLTSVPTSASGEISPWRVAGIHEAFYFWQRVGIGWVAPAALTFMVDRTVKIRSTQSATGLLYVAVVLVLIGEMISRFLYVALGIPQ
jgi:hypothetical protein